MFNHRPTDYTCPFCELLTGRESERDKIEDIVFQNEYATAVIAPKWWINNPGGVLIFPNQHFENIYDIPDVTLGEVYKLVKRVSIAVRTTYDNCEGISTRQHNEPVGDQTLWHLHVHVFPRFMNDNLYLNHDNSSYTSLTQRAPYAEKLRAFLVQS